MGKTTKKKKSKRLKRRIGLIAIGGLSMVLTVCLSVGATLAWFAGSTWASKDLFMGGPVYVEMAGRGMAGNTDNNTPDSIDPNYASWKGGNGELDIIASARDTGTRGTGNDGTGVVDSSNVLLPGQKMLVYSQARVYSTAYYSNVLSPDTGLNSSGANVKNSNYTYTNTQGEKLTTTTSVLRARFKINVEFDPTVGFNNFTDATYANNYPVQSGPYTGSIYKDSLADTATDEDWWGALGALPINDETCSSTTTTAGRRDAATLTDYPTYVSEMAEANEEDHTVTTVTTKAGAAGDLDVFNENTGLLWAVQKGIVKSIYKWKYVSATQYDDAVGTNGYVKMGAPFDGEWNTVGGPSANVENGSGVGFYGVWEVDKTTQDPLESDSFYKVRTEEYLQSYQESYINEENLKLVLQINDQLRNLENALNKSFVKLVNESSDNIMAGLVTGFNATEDGTLTHGAANAAALTQCSWLYVDPSIGNDTNASDSASDKSGWWYLVESENTNSPTSANNAVTTEVDSVTPSSSTVWSTTTTNNITAGTPFVRTGADGLTNSKDSSILKAKLYEITPTVMQATAYGSGTANSNVQKIVSVAFPFVNGMFELPGKELTNIFANAKISFQISFQALQAFFPWSPSIDGLPSGHQLAGLGKALNIENSIPIYNEAFNYLAYLSA